MKLHNLNSFNETNYNLLKANKGQKHFPAAINEWKISSYNYNKSNQRNIAGRNNMADKLIKSYFYFTRLTNKPKSKRMRIFNHKVSFNKVFVTRPEIKQTNDKVTVTVFTYNREKRFLLKKLYYYNRTLTFLNLWKKTKSNKSILSFSALKKNEPIHLIANRIIKQNKTIHAQFLSELIKAKDKIILYNKIINKICLQPLTHKYNVIANKTKQAKYIALAKEKFERDEEETITKKSFIRKKMKISKIKPINIKNRVAYKLKSGIKLKNEMNFLSFRILMGDIKLAYVRKLFYFYFLKYIASIFNLKITVYKESDFANKSVIKDTMYDSEMTKIESNSKAKKKGTRSKKYNFVWNVNRDVSSIYNSPRNIKSEGKTLKLCFFKVKKNASKIRKIMDTRTNKDIANVFNFYEPIIINLNVENENKIENFDITLSKINFIISQFLDKILTNSKLQDKERKLYILYNIYYKRYYKKYINGLAKEEGLDSSYYTKFMINRFKFSNWLPNLKLAIEKIYNKKVELNIINLKYPHLNTEIYSKIISMPIKANASAQLILKKSVSLSAKPAEFIDKSEVKVDYDLNKWPSLYKYKSLKIKNANLTELLNKIYPRSMINNRNSISRSIKNMMETKVIKSKIKNVLMLIKYTSMSGVRIEASGRITKRYTASRSQHSFKYKGNLKNIDYSRVLELKNKSQSAVLLRNQVKANVQYSVTHSKKRVGSFGIKGWTAAY